MRETPPPPPSPLPTDTRLATRFQEAARVMEQHFLDKQEVIRLLLVSVAAGEHMLLVGPPGTAKSALVRTFAKLIDARYFEYLLTRFTEPNELFGPVDIRAFREGTYTRKTETMLPEAELVFLDEIFKSNSAILNILLTIINERKFYQDGVPMPVRLRVLFAATNEVPEQGELAALKDRFVLKAESRSVQEHHFTELIDAGLQADRGDEALGLGERRQFDGLRRRPPERPFAIDVLARLQRRLGRRVVGRHAHDDCDRVDLGRGDHPAVVVEGEPGAVSLARRLGAVGSGGADRRQLHIRTGPHRRQVGTGRPGAGDAGADQAEANLVCHIASPWEPRLQLIVRRRHHRPPARNPHQQQQRQGGKDDDQHQREIVDIADHRRLSGDLVIERGDPRGGRQIEVRRQEWRLRQRIVRTEMLDATIAVATGCEGAATSGSPSHVVVDVPFSKTDKRRFSHPCSGPATSSR